MNQVQTRQLTSHREAICTMSTLCIISHSRVTLSSQTKLDIAIIHQNTTSTKMMILFIHKLSPQAATKTLSNIQAHIRCHKSTFHQIKTIICKLVLDHSCLTSRIQRLPTRNSELFVHLQQILTSVLSEKLTKTELQLFLMLFNHWVKIQRFKKKSGPRYRSLQCMMVMEVISALST